MSTNSSNPPDASAEISADIGAETENRYFRLKVTRLLRKHEDEFTQLCFEGGAEGVAEDLAFLQLNLQYEPDVVETPIFDANVYFTRAPEEGFPSFVERVQSRFPEIGVEMVSEENRDWLAEWKKGFKPFRFAGPYWIVPSWCEPPPEAAADPSKILLMEPGMAFGTGTHETTRLAAGYVLEEITRRKPTAVLDVGTGTGVLALVALRMGVPRIVGLDNDPEARRTARENLELNHAPEIVIPDENIEDVTETFDLVIANIIDGVLTLLRHELDRVLKPGGRLILSGVLVEREQAFYDHFTKETGMKLVKKSSDGEWSAAILEKV